MKIEIKGYRNIAKLIYSISKNKINYLFGVSGSGKSSIAMALNNEITDFDKKINYQGNIVVKLDNIELEENKAMIFNGESLSKYLSDGINEEVFNIIIDEDKELLKEQIEFDRYMVRFKSYIDRYTDQFLELEKISKGLAGSLTSTNKLRKSSKISKLETDFESEKNSRIGKEMNDLPPNKLEWLVDGEKFIVDNVCPFCEKVINKKRLTKIKKYSDFDIKNLNLVRNSNFDFKKVGISPPTYNSTGIMRLKEEVLKASIAVNEFGRLKSTILNIDDEVNVGKLSNITFEDALYTFFPELKKMVQGLNTNIDNINKKTEHLNQTTKDVLRNRVGGINSIIDRIGIPYKIDITYKQNKIKSYKLIHNDDSKFEDRRKSLSNGEKNIIAFLLFVQDFKKNGGGKICIIDDPISSYDEFRRKLIYDYIQNELKDKTVLVLSHDYVFARIASQDHHSRYNGTIKYFDNKNGEISFIEIESKDFGKFDDFLVERIMKSTEYYQKIINLRMLYEGKHASHAYGYLSKILHFAKEETIDTWLISKNKTENDILLSIENDHGVVLEKYKYQSPENIDISNYSLVEKAALTRELIDKKNTLKSELNHIMHVGDRQNICLDPNKYSFCSGSTLIAIDQYLKNLM